MGEGLLGLSQRLPPANVPAEQALLGALMANNKAFDRVAGFLLPEHFADPIHGRVYDAIARRVGAGKVADAITLRRDFEATGLLDDAGGTAYLAQLLTAMVGIINVTDYARAIRDAWHRREMIEIGEQLVNNAFAPGLDDAASIQTQIEAKLSALVERGSDRPMVTMDQALDAALAAADRAKQSEGVTGLQTGFAKIDKAIGGMQRQAVTLLAGRPGMGKSALGMQMAVAAAMQARADKALGGVFVASLEMSAESLGQRILSAYSAVDALRLRDGRHGDWRYQLDLARAELADLPILIDDAGGLSITQIRARAREASRKFGGLSLVMIDHLHIVRPDPGILKSAGMVMALGDISAQAKELAKHLNCHVLALAQLSREVEKREDKRPQMADLRGSGNLEQDADNIAFVFRPSYYLEKDPQKNPGEGDAQYQARCRAHDEAKANAEGRGEVIFEKIRGGRNQTVLLRFKPETVMFEDWS